MYSQNCLGNTDWGFSPCLNAVCMLNMWKGHPLADRKKIALEELEEFPCLGFDQGQHNSFYFAEEVLSTYGYKRFIRANDRATLSRQLMQMERELGVKLFRRGRHNILLT